MNTVIILATGLIPMIVGFLWYNNAFGFGKVWMAENGLTEEELQRTFNPMKVFGFAYLFGVFIATALMPMTIHQMGLFSMVMDVEGLKDTNSEVSKAFAYLMENYGANFRSFKHGAFHGVIYSLFLVLPMLGINGLFERRSWKYIFMHLGYWLITLALMGGVICQFLDLPAMMAR
jgi:hypothetical protein